MNPLEGEPEFEAIDDDGGGGGDVMVMVRVGGKFCWKWAGFC